MTARLTDRQLSVLRNIRTLPTSCNWAGSPPSARKALVAKGLILDVSRVPGRHTQWSSYTITDLGLQVLCGEKFDDGLSIGYREWCQRIDDEKLAAHIMALRDDREWEELHGLHYRVSSVIEADVHAVLWKNVTVLP